MNAELNGHIHALFTRPLQVIIGVSYFGSANKLDGCVNDVHCMARLLMKYWGYKRTDMRVRNLSSPTPTYTHSLFLPSYLSHTKNTSLTAKPHTHIS